jgi:hypothetical protein
MKKITFVFLRGCSPRFSAPDLPPGRHRWHSAITSATTVLSRSIKDGSITSAERSTILSAIAIMLAMPICPRLLAVDDHNPIGVTGAFEGLITTGGAYNVLNHSATRQASVQGDAVLLQPRFICQRPSVCGPVRKAPTLTYERTKYT